jgi:hypothetical protein
MEMSWRNSLYSYPKPKKMSIFFYKIREQEERTGSILGGVSVRRRKYGGKGYGRVSIVKYCVHIYVNGKMKPVETFQEWEQGG